MGSCADTALSGRSYASSHTSVEHEYPRPCPAVLVLNMIVGFTPPRRTRFTPAPAMIDATGLRMIASSPRCLGAANTRASRSGVPSISDSSRPR